MFQKNKRTTSLIIICIFFFAALCFCFFKDTKNSEGWCDTPEEAVQYELEHGAHFFRDEPIEYSLSIRELLDVVYYREYGYAHVIFLTDYDAFTIAVVKYNKDTAQWQYSGMLLSERTWTDPHFIYNNDPDQIILLTYFQEESQPCVHGCKFANGTKVFVNGKEAEIRTFIFEIDGTEYSVEYWTVDELYDLSDTLPPTIEYIQG